MPMATKIKNSATEIVPFLVPSNAHANMTTMFCKTIGTGMNPSGIPGNIPKITMTAVISAICVISFAFIKINSPTLIFWNSVYYELC